MFSSLTLDQDIVGGKGDNDSSRLNNVYIEYVIDGITDIKWIVWVETTENHNEKWADDVDVGPGRIISIMASVEVILIMEPAVEIIMTAEVFFFFPIVAGLPMTPDIWNRGGKFSGEK